MKPDLDLRVPPVAPKKPDIVAVEDLSLQGPLPSLSKSQSSQSLDLSLSPSPSKSAPPSRAASPPPAPTEERHVVLPDASTTHTSRIHLLHLPSELLELICRDHLDITSNTCLGLTCWKLNNITEHLVPFAVNLHMRTAGVCLGHLLTQWMEPMYVFDHSWGKFLTRRRYRDRGEREVERRWREKEGWRKIRLAMDREGACVAYESRSRRRGF